MSNGVSTFVIVIVCATIILAILVSLMQYCFRACVTTYRNAVQQAPAPASSRDRADRCQSRPARYPSRYYRPATAPPVQSQCHYDAGTDTLRSFPVCSYDSEPGARPAAAVPPTHPHGAPSPFDAPPPPYDEVMKNETAALYSYSPR